MIHIVIDVLQHSQCRKQLQLNSKYGKKFINHFKLFLNQVYLHAAVNSHTFLWPQRKLSCTFKDCEVLPILHAWQIYKKDHPMQITPI